MELVHMTRKEPEPGYQKVTELDVMKHEVKYFESRGWKVSGKAAETKEETSTETAETKEEDEAETIVPEVKEDEEKKTSGKRNRHTEE